MKNTPDENQIAADNAENLLVQKVSRREFHKLVALSGLATSGAAWLLATGCSKTYPAQVVAQAGEIPVSGSKIFTYPSDIEPCLLLRPAETQYVAYSRICTHTSCPVFYHPEENRIICPCHGGVYSVADGSVLAGPPPRPLPRITLEQRGNDLVAIAVVKTA
jgi:arsenite oxidase small subunit